MSQDTGGDIDEIFFLYFKRILFCFLEEDVSRHRWRYWRGIFFVVYFKRILFCILEEYVSRHRWRYWWDSRRIFGFSHWGGRQSCQRGSENKVFKRKQLEGPSRSEIWSEIRSEIDPRSDPRSISDFRDTFCQNTLSLVFRVPLKQTSVSSRRSSLLSEVMSYKWV